MKKFLSLTIAAMVLIISSGSVFAANNVSLMATTKGGQHIAECAQSMDKGISDCVKMLECLYYLYIL